MSSRYSKQVLDLIQKGVLVCPVTKKKLKIQQNFLVGQKQKYLFLDNQVPVLLKDSSSIKRYANSSKRMTIEYKPFMQFFKNSLINRIRSFEYRTQSSVSAEQSLFKGLKKKSVCLSVGGGPQRQYKELLNLNISNFPNVDIVGDAHLLPFKDQSVDRVYSVAVFEHLHSPEIACQEIWRVLKKKGRAFVLTPFLQAYHGYPNHYQNYTLTGHDLLFKKQGFKVISSGTAMGPTVALRFMIANYFLNLFPKPFNYILRGLWEPISILVGPLDFLVRNHSKSHFLASTTYTLIEKP
jgi:SAM-dependent methyltransferase